MPVSFNDLCLTVVYYAAFATTWLANSGSIDTERTRRRWLERHMIDSGRIAYAP